jgi:ABC-type dipeptide/oligopeptide/nickel transport system permease subunit
MTTAVPAAGLGRLLPRIRRGKPLLILCCLFLAVLFVVVVAGQWLEPQDPAHQDLLATSQAPGAHHLLGTDALGRDILSRVFAGARSAVLGPLVIAAGAMVVGTVFGLLAGYRGGWTETLILRVCEFLYAMPGALVAIVVVGILGGGLPVAIGVLVVLFAPWDARLVHSVVIQQRNLPYVEAARTLGLPAWRVMGVHILPNIAPTVVANVLLDFVSAIIAVSSLAFLGLGLPAGSPDWGVMIADNRALLGINSWAVIAPAVLIVLAASAMTVVGDWVYDTLSGSVAGRD